jgi:hypothetical protein
MALTKVESALAISLPVIFVVVGLVVILVLTSKTNAKPSTTQVVKPPLNPDENGPRPQKVEACAPGTDGFNGLIPCTKQTTCNGCKEYTDEANQYSCVAVTGGNNGLDANGLLQDPMVVTYKLPPSNTVCTGHGVYDKQTGTCKCDKDYSGKNCDMYQLSIYAPGSYCLPSYAKTCNSPTTDSVLSNLAGGKGSQFVCACKPEYKGLYTQSVEGGVCDVPLVCGASSPQMSADMKSPKQFSVFDSLDANGKPIFKDKPVFTNRPVSYNQFTTEPCIAKTTPLEKGPLAYKHNTVAADADPTCKPTLYSNYCAANVLSSEAGTQAVVRGSNSPGDPLQKRVTPAFFPPVPQALQRCPPGTKGANTPSSPCVCSCDKSTDPNCVCNLGDQLYLQASKKSYCNDYEYDPIVPETDFEDTWHGAAFDDSGQWSGAFTCINDLTSARMKFGVNGEPQLVSSSGWTTVNAFTQIQEVDCIGSDEWATRSTYKAATEEFQRSKACVGPQCEGVQGTRRSGWNGNRDGPLVDEEGKPWFAISGTVDPSTATFGGQCECDGTQYRGRSNVEVKEIPLYISNNSENWWKCGADTCSTESNPGGYLDPTNVRYPQCVCNQPQAAVKIQAPFKTQMSFAPQNETPTCVDDPCNPNGFKTTSTLTCTGDSECTGVCYAQRCHYPRTQQLCFDDSDCINANGARIQGKCVSSVLLDPKTEATTKECLYEDKDRAQVNSTCTFNSDCAYGKCVGFTTQGTSVVGVCSGGCACTPDTVQQSDGSNPLGYSCVSKCALTPCVRANMVDGGSCSVDPITGEQTCGKCKPCFTGKYCELATNDSRVGDRCVPGAKPGEPLHCCEGVCDKDEYICKSSPDWNDNPL